MAHVKLPTGLELEGWGMMKFPCVVCRDLFPARCDNHRVIVDGIFSGNHKPEKSDQQTPQLLLQQRQIRRSKLAFGRPILGYDAPYEILEADIDSVLHPTSA